MEFVSNYATGSTPPPSNRSKQSGQLSAAARWNVTPTQLPGFLPGGISYLGEQSSYRKLLRELAAAPPPTDVYVPPWRQTMSEIYGEEHVRRMRQPPESYEKRAKRFAAEEADRRRSWSRAALRGWTHAGGPAKTD